MAGVNLRPILAAYALPEGFKSEFAKLADKNLAAPLSRTRASGRSLSQITQRQRAQALLAMFVELREGGFKLQSPHNLKQKHIAWLVSHWITTCGHSVGTVELRLTHLRALCDWLGKSAMVGKIEDYVVRPEGYKRSYVATDDKSWVGTEVNASAVIQAIERDDPYVAMQLRLEAGFGLRAQESWRLRPARDILPAGYLDVRDGTKGGRPRQVKIEFAWQYELLEAAARLAAAGNPEKGSLIPSAYSQEKWRGRFYSVLRRHGVTKAGIGVTAHGLRHQYLQELYARVSGQPAAIKGAGEVRDVAAHHEAMRKVVEAAGHSRATKANAYLSTYSTQMSSKRREPTLAEVKAAIVACDGNRAAAARALGISRAKLYRLLGQGES
ncbi:MAG TPA: integrase domain-containing protein [Dongiaceae bacterium]|nr:integrase domain-containing protein [Dongiaceae bacterium]